MRQWKTRQWAVALGATALSALLLGAATALIPNPVFDRMIAPEWWNYPVWIATAVLAGLLTATYVDPAMPRGGAAGAGGGFLAWFAIGCPVCNKLVVLALGTSGALTWFAPLQPVLAVAGMGFLAWALRARLRNARSCPVPASAPGGGDPAEARD
ncbi:hypothetical protein [Salininema proteolyticum]|uniref:Integral membrane protein n=1 Tax=Salininema proteolyticum TaxID=1607685 RepID=A0ABV8U313_9ACTN